MAGIRRDRRLFLAAIFFAFGAMCGILTGKCASASLAVFTTEKLDSYFGSNVMAASILTAMGIPLLLLSLSMTLFGAILILPCILLAGGAAGWSVCCLLRSGIAGILSEPMLLCAMLPQAPCLVFIAASCMRLSASLRTMALRGGMRRPDTTVELRIIAACFFAKLLSAVLFAMLLKRLASF